MKKLRVQVKSFSYRKGAPKLNRAHGGGFIFDCRGITNPGRLERYQPLTGRDSAVAGFLRKLPQTEIFFKASATLVELTIKAFLSRGFTDLGIAFGCTGGRHRSVYFAEKLAKKLRRNRKLQLILKHRDLPKRKSK